MKKFPFVLAFIFLFSSCSPAATMVPPTQSPTVIPTSTNTSTPQPTLTPSLTPTPTLSLPVSYLTSVPSSNSKFSVENLKDLKEIARYYGEMRFTAALSGDQKLLFVRDPVGIDIYDYETRKHINHVDLLGSVRGGSLQVDTAGEWIFVDDAWLVHLTDQKEPVVQNLYSELPLKEGNRFRESSISLDNHKFVSTEIRCDYNGCNIEDRFQIISLPDMQVLYSWEGGYKDMHGQNPVFSPDGSLILTRVENQITIWRTSDQTLVTSIKNIQGNSPAMFSRDSSLIAIGQLDTTQIWDVSSGEPLQTIKGLCGSLYDAPQPIFLGAKSILVLECSRSGKGTVSRWLVADGTATFKRDFGDIAISRIVVDENKNQVSVLANPRKVGPWLFPRIPHTIQFLNNGDLTFRQHDDQLRDISCIIKLNGEMPDCFENLILGTDEQFYSEAFQDNLVKFYRGFTTDGNSTYSLRDLKRWEPGALDPVHGLLFYTTHPLSPCNSESYVMDLATTQTRGKWQCFYIQNAVFSDNGNYAALCRKKDTTFITDKAGLDYLTIFDLSKKETIRQESFTCDVPIAFSSDGSKLIAADTYTKIIGGYVYNRHKLLVMNVLQPIEKNIFDVGCDTLTAIASHPDDSILAVACNDGTLRFLNPDIASEIYRLTNIDPDIWGLAFSKDGTMLAMASKRGYISIWAIPHL